MPELNFDNIKTRSAKSKRRPWDMDDYTPKTSSDEASDVISATKNTSKEEVVIVASQKSDKKALGDIGNHLVTSDEITKLKEEIEKEVRAKYEKQLKKERAKSQDQKRDVEEFEDEKYGSYEAVPKESSLISFAGKKTKGGLIYDILSLAKKLSAPELTFYLYVLQKTDFGSLDHVKIGRRKFEEDEPSVRKFFVDSRNSLVNKGLINFVEGYEKPTRRVSTFYSIL